MELDTASLRVAFVVAALSMLPLFYFVTFRSTRSAYSGWWSAALTLFICGSTAFLLNGTDQQGWANPLGNALLVLGAAGTWAATRSLRSVPVRSWQLAAPALITWIVSMLDSPATDEWAGGPVFLAAMGIMFGLSAVELLASRTGRFGVEGAMALAAGLVSAFYLARCVVFVVAGEDSTIFDVYFGARATTLLTLVFLVVVSYTMTMLSNQQSTSELRRRATRDGLTGLLNRQEFFRLAAVATRALRASHGSAAVILADLDNFKDINDTYGHGAGDRVLETFAAACRATVRSTDLVGRYGGEEFILLLPGSSLDRAEQIAADISGRLSEAQTGSDFPMPTVSYGLAMTAAGVALEATVETADAALYSAKRIGRNRIMRHPVEGDEEGLLDLDEISP